MPAPAEILQLVERFERRIATTDRRIDALAYELYGLTEDEIAIVEGGGGA